MNTFFKKITAAAMAFALLGTGAAVTNSISKTTGKSFGIEADAAGWVIRDKDGTYWGQIGGGRTIEVRYTYLWNLKYRIFKESKNISVYAKAVGNTYDRTSLKIVSASGNTETFTKVYSCKIDGREIVK